MNIILAKTIHTNTCKYVRIKYTCRYWFMAKHILTSISTYCCSHFNDSTRMGTKPTLETEEEVLIKCISADSYVYPHIMELMGRHQQAK